LEAPEEESKKAVCTSVKWRPGSDPDHMIAIDVKGGIRRYSKNDSKLIDSITPEEGEDNRLFALDYSSDGKTFATGGTDHFVRVYDDETMKLKVTLDPFYTNKPGHSNRIFCVAYNKDDPNLIASGGWDNTIIINDIRQKGPIQGILGAYVCGDGIEFYNKKIISGSWRNENQLQVWDASTSDLIKDIDWDGKSFNSLEPVRIFSVSKSRSEDFNSFMIAGGGQSDELKVFNQNFEAVVNITNVSRAIFTTDISHHSDAFLFAGGDGAIRV
jgi:COMPASS component SWD3